MQGMAKSSNEYNRQCFLIGKEIREFMNFKDQRREKANLKDIEKKNKEIK